ncbi:unknown [Eubacterium sp. CAG:115]|nr:unknown [Eubacterium sp. CAG:115]
MLNRSRNRVHRLNRNRLNALNRLRCLGIRLILGVLSLPGLLIRNSRQLRLKRGLAVLRLVCGVVVGIDPGVLSHRENGLKQNAQNDVSNDDVLEYSAESVDGGDALRNAYKHKERRQGVVGYLHDAKRQEALTVRVLHEFARGRILRLRAENLPVKQDPRRD